MNFKISLRQLIGSLVTLIAAAIGVTAASPVVAQSVSPSEQIAQSSSSLMGGWRLVNMTAPGSPMPMLPLQTSETSEVTAEFAGDRISGSGGCNRFMGGFQSQNGQLSIEPLASTFMACESAVMTQETRYLTALQAAQRYEVDDEGYLAIFYQTEQGSGVLRFAAQPAETSESNQPAEPAQPSEPVQALW